MRVLLVSHDFLPHSRAGSEAYTYYLARELAHTGISVELFFAPSASQSSVERRVYEGLPCTVLHKPLHPPLNLFAEEDLWTEAAFRDCLDRLQPDLVHINHLLCLSVNLPAIAKSHRVPVLFTLHHYWLTCSRITKLDRREQPCTVVIPVKCTSCRHSLYSRVSFQPGYITNPLLLPSPGLDLYMATLAMPAAHIHLRRRADQARALSQLGDLWVSPSQFLHDLMIGFGLPRERIVHVPNGLPISQPPRFTLAPVGFTSASSGPRGTTTASTP